eukprot:6721995-Prymnesium_polylepis.1
MRTRPTRAERGREVGSLLLGSGSVSRRLPHPSESHGRAGMPVQAPRYSPMHPHAHQHAHTHRRDPWHS